MKIPRHRIGITPSIDGLQSAIHLSRLNDDARWRCVLTNRRRRHACIHASATLNSRSRNQFASLPTGEWSDRTGPVA